MKNSVSQKNSQSYNPKILSSPRVVNSESQLSPNQTYTLEYENERLRIPEKAMDPKSYQNNYYEPGIHENPMESSQNHLNLPEFGKRNEINNSEMFHNTEREPTSRNNYVSNYRNTKHSDANYFQDAGINEKTGGVLLKLRKHALLKYSIWMHNHSNNEIDCEEEMELLKFERFQTTMQLLVGHILEKPLFHVPPSVTEVFGFPPDAFTLSTITKLLQVSCQIIVIAITAESIQKKDSAVPIQVFSYLIAQAAISLLISLVFLLRIVRVNYRGSIFYASISATLTFVAFGLVLGFLMNSECTANDLQVCHFRRATTGMVSLSTFIWLSEMVIFLTIILVALLEDVLPIPALRKIENRPFIAEEKSFMDHDNDHYDSDEQTIQDTNQEFIVKRYIITENGMEPVTSEEELQNKVKVELYVDEPKKNESSNNKSRSNNNI